MPAIVSTISVYIPTYKTEHGKTPIQRDSYYMPLVTMQAAFDQTEQ